MFITRFFKIFKKEPQPHLLAKTSCKKEFAYGFYSFFKYGIYKTNLKYLIGRIYFSF